MMNTNQQIKERLKDVIAAIVTLLFIVVCIVNIPLMATVTLFVALVGGVLYIFLWAFWRVLNVVILQRLDK